jgi:hypothetical protein
LRGPALGAVLGAVLLGGLDYGIAVVYLGVIQGCWE